MARTFYTERDIQDLAQRGVTEIELNDSVYITDVAREMMDRLGIKRKVVQGPGGSSSALPSPEPAHLRNSPTKTPTLSDGERQEVIDKVKSGVIARLGPGVDAAVVDQIVRRVVDGL